MIFNKKLVHISVLFLVFIILFTSIIIHNKSFVGSKIYIFNSNLTGYEARIINDQAMYDYLTSNQIVDNTNTTQITINIVNNIEEPMFVQQTPEGEDIIAATLIELENGRKEIQIAPYRFVLEQDDKGKWLDSQFLRVAEQIIKRNQMTLEIRNLPLPTLFELTKK